MKSQLKKLVMNCKALARFQLISRFFCHNYPLLGTHTLYLRNSEEISNKAVLLLLYMQGISNKMYASLTLRLSTALTNASHATSLFNIEHERKLEKSLKNNRSLHSYFYLSYQVVFQNHINIW